MGRFFVIVVALAGLGQSVAAGTLVAAHTIRSRTIISASDLLIKKVTIPGALSRLDDAVGYEARVALYVGRPIRSSDIGPPTIIKRNQIISLVFSRGSLNITVEARSLGRAGIGDTLRVMNLSSKTTVTGVVSADGKVRIKN